MGRVGFKKLPDTLTFSQISALILTVSSILSLRTGRIFSHHLFILLAVAFSFSFLLLVLFIIFFKHTIRKGLLFFVLFLIALIYASYRNASFPYPYEKQVVARLRLLSESRLRGKTVQWTARVKGIYIDGEKERPLPRYKVLLNLSNPKTSLKRGYDIRVRGLFMELPYDEAKGYASYLRSRDIRAIFEGYSRDVLIIKKPKNYSLMSVSNRLKRYVGRVNEKLLFYPHSEFATALLTGNRDNIPYNVMESFRKSGTIHILAVSGLHVGFLSMFFLLVLRIFRINQKVIYLLLIFVIVFYMIFIGDSPSVKRASIMVLCGIVVFIFDRDRNYLNVLALAFDVLWITNPLIILNPGFLLSFSATFGILFLVPHFNQWLLKIMPKYLASSLAASFGVQIYIFPVMLTFFQSFPYINIIANIPIVPFTGISFVLEILYLLLYPLFLPLAVVIVEVNLIVITAILRIARLFARVPLITISYFPGQLIPIYFIVVTLFFYILFQRLESTKI